MAKKRDLSGPVADINVTPMADIMLVLLIIFMITTPLLQKGITVNLPRTKNGIEMPGADKRDALVVGVDRMMRMYLGAKQYALADLKERIIEKKEVENPELVYLKSDQAVPYSKIVEIVEMLRDCGFERLGLLTEQKSKKKG